MTAPANLPAAQSPVAPPRPRVVAWVERPFSELLLADPELVATVLIAAGGVGEHVPLPAGFTPSELSARLAVRWSGLIPDRIISASTVTVTATDRRDVLAVAHGDHVLLVIPADGSADPERAAAAAAEAFMAAALAPAPPAPAYGEPLLALSEALTRSGALALVSLPPTLRPVSGWLEPSVARDALDAMVRETLDRTTAWSTRRARLVTTGHPGGATPALAQAAAALLECLGAPGRFLDRPDALLAAWAQADRSECPPLPRSLRRAMAEPLEAGQPSKDKRTERADVASAASERVVEAGPLTVSGADGLSAVQRLRLAARLRATAVEGLCPWLLAAALPSGVLTGCREGEATGGYLFSRPRNGSGFEVVWRPDDGGEQGILIWPRWVLSPALWRGSTALVFIDPEGVWSLSLDGRDGPRRLLEGGFRRLAPSPDGHMLAVTRWPEKETWLVSAVGPPLVIPAAGPAGLAWLETDILAIADSDRIGLYSRSGEGRTSAITTGCARAMSARANRLYLVQEKPCEAGIWRLDLLTGQRDKLMEAPSPVTGLRIGTDGQLVLATANGLWRWQMGGSAVRFSDGLSIGP